MTENNGNKLIDNIAKETREKQFAFNRKSPIDEYDSVDPDALSDGDNFGKGFNNGSIGSAKDISTKQSQIIKNIFNKDKEYKA